MSQPTRKLTEIRTGLRHRKDPGSIVSLAKSIESVGLLHPIVILPDGQLIAGQRRLLALKHLGETTAPVRVVDIDKVARGEFAENAERKDFTMSEMVAIKRAIEPDEREVAAERKSDGQKAGGRGKKKLGAKLAQSKARDRVAEFAGRGRTTLKRAEEIVAAAESEPEKHADLQAEMDRTNRVNGVYKKLKTRRVAEQIRKEIAPPPAGPFRVIVIDPPWLYKSRSNDPSHRAANPYPSMSLESIGALDVAGLAEKNCILWLWTTNAHLEHAFGIARGWGFEPKTVLTWVKNKLGLGDWLRSQTEHCLFCVRGKPCVTLKGQTTALVAPAREHSRKPDKFYTLVESLCPGSKLEMFARESRKGWERWGAEANES